ncbi:unnamed protein product, partial [Symbiodinium sp. KB8]
TEASSLDAKPQLLDRRRIVRSREAFPSVTVVIHDTLATVTTSIVALPRDSPDLLALHAAVACGRDWGERAALLVPASAGPVVLWSQPGGVSAVRSLGELCRTVDRPWLHVIRVGRPLGRAAAGQVAAFLGKSLAPMRGRVWNTEPRVDFAGLGRRFPDRDEVQTRLDWLLRAGSLALGRAERASAGLGKQSAARAAAMAMAGQGDDGDETAARTAADLATNLRRLGQGEGHLLGAPASVMRAHGLRA